MLNDLIEEGIRLILERENRKTSHSLYTINYHIVLYLKYRHSIFKVIDFNYNF